MRRYILIESVKIIGLIPEYYYRCNIHHSTAQMIVHPLRNNNPLTF